MTTLRDGIELFASRAFAAGGIVEISLLKTRKQTITGYFNNVDDAAREVETPRGVQEEGTYISLNAVDPELLARANNRLKEWSKVRTSDDQIIRRLWLALDLDAKRPTGMSASQEELNAALERRDAVVTWLLEQGWPSPIYMTGGNGGHALFAVDEPNDANTKVLFEAILKGLSAKFSDASVNVDSTVHNAARIWTLPGSVKHKGDDFPTRPHRMASIESRPENLELVTREQLEAVALLLQPAKSAVPVASKKSSRVPINAPILDMRAEFESRGWYLNELTEGKHAVKCPWSEEHSGDSGVTQTVLFNPPEEGKPWGFNCQHSHCVDRTIKDVWQLVRPQGPDAPADEPLGVGLDDFAFIPKDDKYLCIPTNDMWPASALDKTFPKRHKNDCASSVWVAQHNRVDQRAWIPGRPKYVLDTIVTDGGLNPKRGYRIANQYQEPLRTEGGDKYDIDPWLSHLSLLYPDTFEHIVKWFAHRVQHPDQKVNHALVWGGPQGIGKDTLMEPLRVGVGPWNFKEIPPSALLGNFNEYVQCIVLRVSEASNLGDQNRWQLYERTKTLTTIPPETYRVNRKYEPEYYIINVCGVLVTTNHRDGLYIPPDDRRFHVSWCDTHRKEDFTPAYFDAIWDWYMRGGLANVIAYLRDPELLEDFDAMNPPPKTAAWHAMVGEGFSSEFSDLNEALDKLNRPEVVSIKDIRAAGSPSLERWMDNRSNRRQVRRELEEIGYEFTRNMGVKDGYWTVNGQGRVALYARRGSSEVERQKAVRHYVREREGTDA